MYGSTPCKNDKGRQACGCRFSSDKACRSVVYFYGCFFKLRIKLPTKLCRFRQGFVVSDKRFVGKSRATILHNTPDVILRTFVPRRTYMTSVFAVTRRQGLPVLQYLHKAAVQTYQIRFVQNRWYSQYIQEGFKAFWVSGLPQPSTNSTRGGIVPTQRDRAPCRQTRDSRPCGWSSSEKILVMCGSV